MPLQYSDFYGSSWCFKMNFPVESLKCRRAMSARRQPDISAVLCHNMTSQI